MSRELKGVKVTGPKKLAVTPPSSMDQAAGRHPFKTQYNYLKFPDKGEVNKEPSETKPNEALSVRELLHRHLRGLSTDITVPPYDTQLEDVVMPDLTNMTEIERLEAIEEVRQELELRVEKLKKIKDDYEAEEKRKAEALLQKINQVTVDGQRPGAETPAKAGDGLEPSKPIS